MHPLHKHTHKHTHSRLHADSCIQYANPGNISGDPFCTTRPASSLMVFAWSILDWREVKGFLSPVLSFLVLSSVSPSLPTWICLFARGCQRLMSLSTNVSLQHLRWNDKCWGIIPRVNPDHSQSAAWKHWTAGATLLTDTQFCFYHKKKTCRVWRGVEDTHLGLQ